MKKNNLTGWQEVFTFTLKQTLKNKTYLISLIIMVLISLVSMPLYGLITGQGGMNIGGITGQGDMGSVGISPIQKIFVFNETLLQDLDFKELVKGEEFSHIAFEQSTKSYEEVSKMVEEEQRNAVILTMTEDEQMVSLHFLKAKDGPIKDKDVNVLGQKISEELQTVRMNRLGLTEEQKALLNSPVESEVLEADSSGEVIMKEDTSITFNEYWVVYGILFFLMMVNILASTQVASAIVVEKSTRVVEYLLITVRPLALMVGKVLAMLLAALIQMLGMITGLFLSNFISAIISGKENGMLGTFISADILGNISIGKLIPCILLVVLGMIFYGTLAGLSGATVSRMEELNEGMTLLTITNLVGVYIGLIASSTLMGAGMNGFVIFALLFPLSSPFFLPGAILIGKASLPIIGIAIVLEVVTVIAMFFFVAKIYEALILHNGNRIKMKDLIRFSKTA